MSELAISFQNITKHYINIIPRAVKYKTKQIQAG